MRSIFRRSAEKYALNAQTASNRLLDNAHSFNGTQAPLTEFDAVKGAAKVLDLGIMTPVNTP
jgi:hypothetical protein